MLTQERVIWTRLGQLGLLVNRRLSRLHVETMKGIFTPLYLKSFLLGIYFHKSKGNNLGRIENKTFIHFIIKTIQVNTIDILYKGM